MPIPFSYLTGLIKDAQGNPRANTEVLFQPLDTPFAYDNEVATSTLLSITTDVDGSIGTLKLLQGSYQVVISDADAYTITMPGDELTYPIDTVVVNLPDPVSSSSGRAGNQLTPANVQRLFQTTKNVVHHLNGDDAAEYDRLAVFGGGNGDADSLNTLQQHYEVSYFLCTGNMNLASALANFAQWIKGQPENTSEHYFYSCLGSLNYSGDPVEAVSEYTSVYEFEGNERYYKATLIYRLHQTGGDLEMIDLFVVNSNAAEVDGNTQTSVQANWLRTQLSSSTARWKFVMFYDAPFASKSGYSFSAMDWPFGDWGADAVFCSGVGFYERLQKGGIPYFVLGTFRSTLETPGTAIAESRFNLSAKGFLTCEFNERSLRFYFINTEGRAYDLVERVHKDTNVISSNIRLAANSGLRNTENGLSLDFGVADGKALGSFDRFIQISESRFVQMDTIPTADFIRANGWLKKCMYLIGDDPPKIYYWNKASSTVEKWLPDGMSDVSLFSGARTKLVVPGFSPDASPSLSTLVYHIDPDDPDPDVTLWISINGSEFSAQANNPAFIFFGNPKTGKTVISAFATKVGFIDSDISSIQYESLSDQFAFNIQI